MIPFFVADSESVRENCGLVRDLNLKPAADWLVVMTISQKSPIIIIHNNYKRDVCATVDNTPSTAHKVSHYSLYHGLGLGARVRVLHVKSMGPGRGPVSSSHDTFNSKMLSKLSL